MRLSRFPLVSQVAGQIYSEMQAAHDPHLDGEREDTSCDVRLVVRAEVAKGRAVVTRDAVNFGLSDYDQWHGFCGASSFDMSARPNMREARRIAADLVEQVKEQIASA